MDPAGWDERYRSTERLWSSRPNVFVEDRLRDAPPGAGLDLASGEGRNAIWLAGLGWDMTAVDFSPVALGRGREQSDLVHFVEADVLTWEPDREFDLVLIAYLHLVEADFERVVKRAAGWVAEGGELFMIGHDRSNLEFGVGGPQVPEILWDVDRILGWLDGLTVIESGIVERQVETENGVRMALDALVRARA